jgi:protein subunit release factor B
VAGTKAFSCGQYRKRPKEPYEFTRNLRENYISHHEKAVGRAEEEEFGRQKIKPFLSSAT